MNNVVLFALALVPILWLMLALGVMKWPGYKACPIGLVITLVLAIFVWKMSPLDSLSAALEGVAMAVWPICLVIVAAVFTYNMSLHTGGMEIIKKLITGVTSDKRILVLILAWGFGGFLEAIAGFGTAVAIPAGILYALGFDPVFAAILCLIANTTPTAFGAIGTPVLTLAQVTGLDVSTLSYAVALQLMPLIIMLPVALVMLTGRSVKAINGVWIITLLSGAAFALPQVLIAKYLGAELPAVVGSICSIIVTILATKMFGKNIKHTELYQIDQKKSEVFSERISFKEAFMACLPFLMVFLFILGTSTLVPPVNTLLSHVKTSVHIFTGHKESVYVFKWIATPGTLIILATYLASLIQGESISTITRVLWQTVVQMKKTIVTIIAIIALAKVMGYSGMINAIATVLVMVTGSFYPFIAPLIGALGTFVTGSDTSANVLFGKLQVEAAKAAGANPYWIAAINTGGATAGKMISPQSIAVAVAATGIAGKEGRILSTALKFCIVYVLLLSFISYFCAPLFGFY